MSFNFLPYVSWGMYGGKTGTQRACFLVSRGLRESLQNVTFIVVAPDYILLIDGRVARKLTEELYVLVS